MASLPKYCLLGLKNSVHIIKNKFNRKNCGVLKSTGPYRLLHLPLTQHNTCS